MDYADEQVTRAVRVGRKGTLAAYRNATLFKVVYEWGLRRTGTAKLDLLDWGPQVREHPRPISPLKPIPGRCIRAQDERTTPRKPNEPRWTTNHEG